MAAALHAPRNDPGTNVHVNLYPRALMTDLDFKDNRYPTIPPQHRNSQRASGMMGPSDRPAWDGSPHPNDTPRRSADPFLPSALNPTWAPDSRTQPDPQSLHPSQFRAGPSADSQSYQSQSHQVPEPQRSALSYALPPGAARRVVERYSLDDNSPQRTPSRGSVETRPTVIDSAADLPRSRSGTPQGVRPLTPQERSPSHIPSTPRHTPTPGLGFASLDMNSLSPGASSGGILGSQAYTPPIAPKHRAQPQQPTFITPPAAPTPINTIYSPTPPRPQEEVCVECAMRDQDMADVDVTSPGIWERESDVLFEELQRREREEEVAGVVAVDDHSRPRSKGGRLTEQNLKIWLSVNPKEPASRQQTLNTYIRAQRALLEAEALAHARAMQEAKQLDNRMRDAYSQLRRSAYDTGNSAAPADDLGGVRIKPPKSPVSPTNPMHGRVHSREITLLENGMIVEHVDVRKEEREARERRRRQEKRARKSSRSSGIDVTSIISAQSYGLQTDNGLSLKPHSRYSQASSPRPTSVLTAPIDRGDLPRAYSQTSFSDVHSLGSASPRRTRFFGIRSMAGWKSQDSLAPSGMSGSMVNMHLASQRELHGGAYPLPVDLNTPRRSQIWPPSGIDAGSPEPTAEDKPKKKKKGLAKIWQIVTGSSKNETPSGREPSRSYDRNDDDQPLAPPPPLSYLVERGPSELLSNNRGHASTPSLPSTASPKNGLSSPGMSPPTAPSSILPSPASSLPSGPGVGIEPKVVENANEDQDALQQHNEDTIGKGPNGALRNIHSMTSEPDMRQRLVQQSPPPPMPSLVTFSGSQPPSSPPLAREKSLPPLPGEPRPRTLTTVVDTRPRTVYTYDSRHLPPGTSPPHDFLPPNAAFRAPDSRRQSFGGMTSRPNLSLQTMPSPSPPSLSPRYDEFGLSRRSLGPVDHGQDQQYRNSPAPTTKRKSRFGFSSLLGKKHVAQEPDLHDGNRHLFPTLGHGSDGQDDYTANGHATSTSRHSALSAGSPVPRMSMMSRKPLEELVAQDPDFVAYRYPSNDQRLDLLR